MQILNDNEHSFVFCMGLVRNKDDKHSICKMTKMIKPKNKIT